MVLEGVEIKRQSVDYPPSVWGDYFIKHNAPISTTIQKSEEWMKERVKELVIAVKVLLNNNKNELELLELIDSIQRLGIGYHFEGEIDGRLRELMLHYTDYYNLGKNEEMGLHGEALKFRLLRQHGYFVSSDAFYSHKDHKGNFKSILAEDIRGLLSLYEACFLRTHADNILDEALDFTKHHLLRIQTDWEQQIGSNLMLKELVSHALQFPLYRRIPRLEAKYYITIYEQDKEHRNDIILELAKLDFNLLQLLHYEEVKNLSIWWEGIEATKYFSFSRDRLVESYFWSLATLYEPQYSVARIIFAKLTAILTITDDLIDNFGSLREVMLLIDTMLRRGAKAPEQLPVCMKHFSNIIDDFFQELESKLNACGYFHREDYLKIIFQESAKAYVAEIKWRDEEYTAGLIEHLQVSTLSSSSTLMCCAAFIAMGDLATKEVLQWIAAFPKFMYHSCVIMRIKDDIVSNELEQKRIHVASTVQCYMKEHNCGIDEAYEGLKKVVENEWKSLNHEYLILNSIISKTLLERVINQTRIMEISYDIMDRFTNSANLKDYISSVLTVPF